MSPLILMLLILLPFTTALLTWVLLTRKLGAAQFHQRAELEVLRGAEAQARSREQEHIRNLAATQLALQTALSAEAGATARLDASRQQLVELHTPLQSGADAIENLRGSSRGGRMYLPGRSRNWSSRHCGFASSRHFSSR